MAKAAVSPASGSMAESAATTAPSAFSATVSADSTMSVGASLTGADFTALRPDGTENSSWADAGCRPSLSTLASGPLASVTSCFAADRMPGVVISSDAPRGSDKPELSVSLDFSSRPGVFAGRPGGNGATPPLKSAPPRSVAAGDCWSSGGPSPKCRFP